MTERGISLRANAPHVILRYSEGSGSATAKEPDPSEYLRMTWGTPRTTRAFRASSFEFPDRPPPAIHPHERPRARAGHQQHAPGQLQDVRVSHRHHIRNDPRHKKP